MIDPTLPMELDDGTPVTIAGIPRPGATHIMIRHLVAPTRPGRIANHRNWSSPTKSFWSYRVSDGVFEGGNAKNQFVLRNSNAAPEEYEDWFV